MKFKTLIRYTALAGSMFAAGFALGRLSKEGEEPEHEG